MKSFKKLAIVISVILSLSIIVSACVKPQGDQSDTQNGSTSDTPETVTEKKIPIKFYGRIMEFPDGDAMIQKMQELLPKYEIQPIQVDWGNLDKVVSIGIASGDPCDVYAFWPTMMQKYVDAEQALDLTPYLDENDGEWRKQLSKGSLEMGTFNDKVYNVSYQISFDCLFVNADAFDKAGLTVNPKWTWDEFTTAMNALKENGEIETPFSIFDDAVKGLFFKSLDDLINNVGKTDDSVISNYPLNGDDSKLVLSSIKTLFDSGLWYGGKGGLNISRDEAKAAFVQGKTAVLVEGAAIYASLAEECDFKIEPVLYPTMKNDPSQVAAGGYGDGLFIPSNAKYTEEAVECLKVFTGSEVQKIHADAGFVVTNTSTQPTDPTVLKLVEFTQNIGDGKSFTNMSTQKFYDHINKVMLPNVLLNNESIDKSVDKLDELRKEIVAEAADN